MQAVLFDVNKKKFGAISIEDNAAKMAARIGCDWIGITRRKVGGKNFEVVYDDEGLLKNDIKLSGVYSEKVARKVGTPVAFVGSLIITGMTDINGNLTGLTNDDVDLIAAHVRPHYTEGYPMLFDIEI